MNKTACSGQERLNKKTLLGLLPSKIDTSKVVVTATKRPLDVTGVPNSTIFANLRDGIWLPFEEILPRRFLLYADHWSIKSFNPRTRECCITMESPAGTHTLSVTVELLP